MPDDPSGSKRQRVSKACEQCRRKKVKCDGALPLCGNCVALQIQCTYKESTRKRGPPKGYIEAIEGRLHRLEALLGSIVQEGDPRFQAVMNELNAPLETAYGELVRPRPMQRAMIAGFEEPADMRNVEEMHRHHNDPGKMTTVDSVNDNMCNVSIDESGQLRYYGRSSGFYMLQGSKNFHNGSFQFSSGGQEAAAGGIRVDPFEMPPEDLSNHLLDLYFKYFYPLIPLLHKKKFMRSLNDKSNPPSPLLLNAIYAVASRVSSDSRVRTDPDQPDTAGEVFFERARLLLDLEFNNFRISTVQSLLLMSSHQNGALKPTRGWIYSGMAFRMAQNLGLHRNCDTWNLSEEEKQERKRTFFCCFVIDRLTCAMHGRSPMIDERDYDTPYPTENDQDDVGRTPRIMENFTQLIRLCEILGDILRDLYMVKGRKQLSVMATPDSVISTLDRALNQWMAKLPPSLRYRPPNTRLAETAPAPALETCQLHMLFYTTLILLHRPFIPGSTQNIAPSVYPSASICTFAANKILDIAESLLAEGRLTSVNNYTLYFMFTAGVIFIYNAQSTDSMFAFEAKISINKLMRAMDEMEKTWITSFVNQSFYAMDTVYNFGAGPAKIPEEVLARAQKELINYNNTGMSVMELSHRSKPFAEILERTKSNLRKLMGIPDNYEILFMQGGATTQFSALVYNLLAVKQQALRAQGKSVDNITADYYVTGAWSNKAVQEAERLASHVGLKHVNRVVDAKKQTGYFGSIPTEQHFSPDPSNTAYVYYCDNETIHGVEFQEPPKVPEGVPLVADMSSNFLSRPVDVSKYGVIYGGAQKNLGPAGVTLVIIRKDLIPASLNDPPLRPLMLDYRTLADNDSLYNTPPTFAIYMVSLTLEWILQHGGLEGMQKRNKAKADKLYEAIDTLSLFKSPVDKQCRSRMNVVFTMDSPELEKEFLKGAEERNMVQLKGHRSTGGIRSSIYNAMPQEHVEKLIDYMKQFQQEHST